MFFLYFIVRGTDTVSIVWYLGENVYMCWELTDFCDVRRLADGQFSQSVCFLTWAPVSQVRTLRLFAIFLEIRAAPPQEGWRPSLFNRSGLPQKLVQLSIKSVLFCKHHLDIQPLSDNSLLWISSPDKRGSGQSILQMWWRRLVEVQTEHQNGKERGFKWLWTWNGCWCQVGWSEYFKNCWSTGNFTYNHL